MEFLKYLVSLLVIIDPVFAAIMAAGLVEPKDIKNVAFKASATLFTAGLVTLILGDNLLKLLGINLFSIKIFGGLILLQMAFQMLQARPPRTKHTEEESRAANEKEDISVIPLGIPMLFGPGAFTTVLIFKEESAGLLSILYLLIALLLVSLFTYFLIVNSILIYRRMGITGINVTVRVFGLFVGALGSQFVVDGIKHLWIEG